MSQLEVRQQISLATPFTAHAHVEVPLICGAIYPCSNPELVAAVSEAVAIGIVQPIPLTYVDGHEFRAGLRYDSGSLGVRSAATWPTPATASAAATVAV